VQGRSAASSQTQMMVLRLYSGLVAGWTTGDLGFDSWYGRQFMSGGSCPIDGIYSVWVEVSITTDVTHKTKLPVTPVPCL
jgi:hypothetical protein